MDEQVPVEGITIEVVPDVDGWYMLHGPTGKSFTRLSVIGLTKHGIPIPKPPRVGTLGLSEEDTRMLACSAYAITSKSDKHDLMVAAAYNLCREDVERWDAEDRASSVAY